MFDIVTVFCPNGSFYGQRNWFYCLPIPWDRPINKVNN